MVLIPDNFPDKFRESLIRKWSEHYFEYVDQPYFFDLVSPSKPISRIQCFKNRILYKFEEIKDGLRIIFKGEYPEC